jgi:hypothetical protein
LIGLCEGLCVVFEDDSVVVFVSGKVVDDVKEKIENAVSRNVLEFINEIVRGCFDADVEDGVLNTRATAAENHVAIRVPEPVVRQVVGAVED